MPAAARWRTYIATGGLLAGCAVFLASQVLQHREDPQYQSFLDFYSVLYIPEIDSVAHKDWSSRTYPANLTNRFDWQFWPSKVGSFPGHHRVKDPQTVYALPKAVGELLRIAALEFDPGRSDRIVVFGGDETPLSEAFGRTPAEREQTVRSLRRWFRAVFYYVKDVDVEGVITMPVGLSHFYFPQGEATIAAAKVIASVRPDASFKDKTVLASFSVGSQDHLEMATRYSDKKWLQTFADLQCEPPSQAIAADAFGQRMEVADWGQTEAATAVGLEFRRVPGAGRWWQELARYKFLICPLGSGIQSFKVFEAMLVLTVPVVKRGAYPVFDDLVRLGFPLLVVDEWGELTPSKLNSSWQTLAPRLASFRRNCLTAAGFWQIFTSGDHSCY